MLKVILSREVWPAYAMIAWSIALYFMMPSIPAWLTLMLCIWMMRACIAMMREAGGEYERLRRYIADEDPG